MSEYTDADFERDLLRSKSYKAEIANPATDRIIADRNDKAQQLLHAKELESRLAAAEKVCEAAKGLSVAVHDARDFYYTNEPLRIALAEWEAVKS